MPTLEELLTMSEDNTCNINEESRAISVPKELVLGVESDERTNRVYFRCKKIVGDNVDLTAYQLNVNYMNANGEKDRYIIEDINPDTSDTSYITFSWLLSRNVTKYKGAITFIVCALNTQADGRIKNEWSTTLAQANVLQGLKVDDIVIDTPQMDIINQLLNLVDSTVEQGKEQAISAIKAQGEEVQENISESVNTANTAKTNLETATDTANTATGNANTAKTNLDGSISKANTAKTNVDDSTSVANTAKTNLETATTSANNAESTLKSATSTAQTATASANDVKNNLDSSISSANSAKSALDTATNNANDAKTNADTARTNLQNVIDDSTTKATSLQGVIDSATAINNTLGTTNDTASTAKTNLETAINNASTTKSQLEQDITNAGTLESQLSQAITDATTTNTTLNGTIQSGNNLNQDLDVSNASAKLNIEELRSENFNSREILTGVDDIKAYIGYTDEDIVGIQVDYENKSFQRLAGAYELSAGVDFDKYAMFGGRKRCTVVDDGTIVTWFGDADYAEDGTMGQVMVYQPKFYYKVVPLKTDPITDGIGHHLRKANYYVSTKPKTGFRLHPAFYDENGNEVDYVLMGAYEGSLYDVSASAYILDDSQVMDYANDKFCSIASAKPTSGLSQDLTRPKIEQMARNRGTGFHLENIKMTSMNQLLMIIEMGMMNLQTAIAQGVVSISDSSAYNCSSLTGSTSSLGNGTGRATQTINTKGDASTTETVNGKTAITYRGLENPWGNIWKFIYGVNLWGNGAMGGGQPFICTDFNYAEGKNSDNYEGAGFTVTNADGYISAIGYSTTCDWLFMASECLGNSSLPVGDYFRVTTNLNGYRIALLGGFWINGSNTGAFFLYLNAGVGNRNRDIGGRLVYVPTATA